MFKTQKKFLAAAAEGNISLLDEYLKADKGWHDAADKAGDTALHHAARAGQLATIKYLMEKFPSLVSTMNKGNRPPLTLAIIAGQTAAAQMLMNDKSAPALINRRDSNGLTPLQHAIRADNAEVLKLFLETGKADLNYNAPAVYVAVTHRAGKCIDVLLDFNANPNVPSVKTNYDSWMSRIETRTSSLNMAVQLDETEIALKLLAAGAKHEEGEAPLALAAKNGNMALAQALLLHGIRANARDKSGLTALHTAARAGKADMVRYLLDNGADKNVKDDNGQTALNIAQQFAMKEIADLLQEPKREQPRIQLTAPPAAAAAAPAPAPKPEASKASAGDAASWQRAGEHGVARIETFTNLGRRLTQIFNFETRERLTIAENLLTRAESIGPAESFDNLVEAPLAEALRQFQRLGGKAKSEDVLKTRLAKAQFRQL